MKLDWKSILGAAFVVAALLGSGAARAFETAVNDPRTAMVCHCARSGFGTPDCKVIKEQTFGAGGMSTTQAHSSGAVMPASPASAPVTAKKPGT